MNKYYVGIDIGGTTAKFCLYRSGEGEEGIISKWNISTDKALDSDTQLANIAESVKTSCKEQGISINDVSGIGIGIPGPVNADGVVLECVNLNFGIVPVRDIMAKLTGIDNVVVGNDANVAALGEMWKGGAEGFKDVLMVTLGTGIGGGLIIDGKIHVGSGGAAAEIGHITVNPDEPECCGCGCHGCIEQYASATGVVRIAKDILANDNNSVLNADTVTAKDVFDAAKNGDRVALEVVNRFAGYLGMALSNIAAVADPQVFIIGGGVSAAGTIITDSVKKYYEQFSMNALKDREIRLATLGNDAGVLGCIKMAIDGDDDR